MSDTELVLPAKWGRSSDPISRADFEQLKARLEATILEGGPYRSAEVYRVAFFTQEAPFIQQAVSELIEEGKIRKSLLNKGLRPI